MDSLLLLCRMNIVFLESVRNIDEGKHYPLKYQAFEVDTPQKAGMLVKP
jgi:hypothetical protein